MMAGRKTKYKKQYCQELIEYFDKPAYKEHEQVFVGKDGREWSKFEYIANDLPTIIGFCCKIGISKQTFIIGLINISHFLTPIRI